MTKNVKSGLTLKQSDWADLVQTLRQIAGPKVKKMKCTPTGTDAWYQASYLVFRDADPNDADEFLKVVAYAYSWVATIGTTDPRIHFNKVKKAVDSMRDAESKSDYCCETPSDTAVRFVCEARKRAVDAVQAALGINPKNNNSIVIVSKVLHFWNSEIAPMIDKNVANAWQRLSDTPTTGENWTKCLCMASGGTVSTLSMSPSKSQFLGYWEIAFRFRQNNLTYRELDEHLFCHGRS